MKATGLLGRTALVRFPDEASLRRFWNSPENAPMKELRHGTATSHVAMCIQFQAMIRQSKPLVLRQNSSRL
jgi:hypothetical protein